MLRLQAVLLILSFLLVQCRNDRTGDGEISNDPSQKLSFSDDVVLFDTIFSTVGSTTRWLKVYNPGNHAIEISSISLKGVNNAYFRMNVDGESGSLVKSVFLAGKDSLFIFIDVTIDPDVGDQLPFLVEGSIEFLTNGNLQKVTLLAYGQRAYFITPDHFPGNIPPYSIVMNGENQDTTWNNTLPIVVYGYAVVDSNQHLTIEKGTQIHFHANSGLWVYRYGQITVNGTLEEPVVFQGDRLDDYKDIAGSWDRIWINDGENGKDNDFNYAIIKNSFIGIHAEYNPFTGIKNDWAHNQINLRNTKILNTSYAGIYATNHRILGINTLVGNSGQFNLAIFGGGQYLFQHCTFANYYRGGSRSSPAVYLSHVYEDNSGNPYGDSMVIDFRNSIVYGDHESEFNIEDEFEPGKRINFSFDHCLLKSNIDHKKYGTYTDTIFNPSNSNIFTDPYMDDFSLSPSSPAINKGDPLAAPPVNVDIEGKARSDGKPDLGAFESD